MMQFLTTFISGGVIGVLIKTDIDYWRDARSRKESVRYLALRIAFAFEGYAIECAKMVSNHKLAESSGGEAGNHLGSVPQHPALPDNSAYALIKTDILEGLLDFPQQCQMADGEVASWWDVVGDIDCVRTAATENTVKMGERGLHLADRLRQESKLPKRELKFGNWNICTFFSDELKRIAEIKARRSESEAKSRKRRRQDHE